jgi:ABC-type phosphate transport system ATPase subunit
MLTRKATIWSPVSGNGRRRRRSNQRAGDGRRPTVAPGKTSEVFTNPREQRTQDYVTGRFG